MSIIIEVVLKVMKGGRSISVCEGMEAPVGGRFPMGPR